MNISKKEKIISSKIDRLVFDFCKIKYKKKKFLPNIDNVPVTSKIIGYQETKNIIFSALDGWLTTGRYNDQFEIEIAKKIGSKLAITTNSGSSSNLIAFTTLCSEKLGERQIKKGDEIITVAASFPTTVTPIIQNNCIPVFLDVELKTYNIKINEIENAITKKTKAIMIAHTLGNPYNLDKIRKICDKYNLWLIQDCCDALGAKFNDKNLGYFGDIGSLSFYPAHQITMGEGGVVFFNSLKLKRIAESIRDWGRDCYCKTGHDNTCNKRFGWRLGKLPFGYDHKYTYSHLGYNLKITDMQAACGLAQIHKLSAFVKKRERNHSYLLKKLQKFSSIFILPKKHKKSKPSWFGFLLTIKDKKVNREDLLRFLNQHKIGTRLLFAGNLTKQPNFKNQKYKIFKQLTNTDLVMNNSFWVGVHPGLDKKELDYIIKKISEFLKVNKII